MRLRLALAIVALGACSSRPVTPLPAVDPIDVDPDLRAVLQHDYAKDACRRYDQGARDRNTVLLCGKYRFFYGSFGMRGIPSTIVEFLPKHFPGEIGVGYARLGMIPDPYSDAGMPIGLVDGPTRGLSPTKVFGCASCHFGQLPDGRYAVGAPNHAYEYGTQILAFVSFPPLALEGNPEKHDPSAVAKLQPMLDRVAADPKLKGSLSGALLPALGAGAPPSFDRTTEAEYASWPPGTMDFLINPLPIDDHVHTVSRIPPIWNLVRPETASAVGMPHGRLGWTGGVRGAASFMRAFVRLFGGELDDATTRDIEPVVEYLYSLTPPPAPAQDAAGTARGRALFGARCTSCHDGPSGESSAIYPFAQLGTDPALGRWLDPDGDLQPPADAQLEPGDTLTGQIKAPRLFGLWGQHRFLHNGALGSLEQLFCLQPRPPSLGDALDTAGHTMTCDGLTDAEKHDLLTYLRSL